MPSTTPASTGSPTRPTSFAPAARSDDAVIQRQHLALADEPLIRGMLDCFPESALVLNAERQAVMVNDKLEALLGQPQASILGRRPGELISCLHAENDTGGCGTSHFCRHCGAVRGILRCQQTRTRHVDDCRITRRVGGEESSLDLRVWTTPLTWKGEEFSVFAIRDVTDEKRRQALERIFFHDILNTAGGLQGLLRLIPDLEPGDAQELSGDAARAADQLIEEIQAQKDLASAERGDLDPRTSPVPVLPLLEQLGASYRSHLVARDRQIVVDPRADADIVDTDPTLLRRVLGNLVKNALEASRDGQVVTVGHRHARGDARPHVFSVHNATCMTETVKLQVFQRSFSTKGTPGRGLGTYSVKLLTERYLGGTVDFASSETEGTTFRVRLP